MLGANKKAHLYGAPLWFLVVLSLCFGVGFAGILLFHLLCQFLALLGAGLGTLLGLLNDLRKRLDAGNGAAENQGVDVVGTFVGIDGFQVRGVAHHVIFNLDAVAAMHVA